MKATYLTLYVLFAMYRRRWWEPVMVFLAITIACAGLTAVSLINQGAEKELNTSVHSLLDFSYQITAKQDSEPVSPADYARLRLLGFTELVAYSRYTGPLTIDSTLTESYATVIGIDSLAAAQAWEQDDSALSGVTAPAITAGAVYTGANTFPGVPEGAIVAVQNGPPMQLLRNGKIPDEVLITDLHTFYRPPLTLQAYPLSGLAVTRPLTGTRVAELRAALPAHLKLTAQHQPVQNNSLAKSFSLNLWAMGMLMAVVSLFIVLNALHLMYRARMPNLLRLRQMGVGIAAIGQALLLEMVLLTLAGCITGVLLGAQFTLWSSPVLNSVFDTIFETSYLAVNPVIWQMSLRAWIISCVAVALTMALPFYQLRNQLLIKQQISKDQRNLLVPLSLVSVIISLVLIVTSYSQTTALLAISSTLLCGCLLTALGLPGLLGKLADRLPPRRVLLHWSMANAKTLTGRTRLAISAFVVALAANSGMNVMVDSFRQATEDWLTQRLVAPYYITNVADTPDKADVPAGIEIFPRLASNAIAHKAGNAEAVEIRSYPQDEVFRAGLGFDNNIPTPWEHFDKEQAVFINQQLAYRFGIKRWRYSRAG